VKAVRAPSREVTSARAALILVALAVIVDAFVAREPGTSITDHLAGGLVPAAAAVGLAVLYPRLRPGARALVALVCGSLAIVAGIAAGALLSGVAGFALLVVGATVLWRSRRMDRRTPLIAVAALLGIYFVVLPLALAIVVNHKARSAVEPADLGAPYRSIALTTEDGLRLAGWYAPSRNGATVIVFPGRRGPVRHARLLARHGYGVLMLDRRGEGESEGDYNARGWGGEPDLEAAIDYLAARHQDRIGGLGLSVGGELLLQTAARDPRLRAVVSEGAGRQSLADQLQTPDVPKAIRWLSPMTIETAAGVVLANRMPPGGLVDALPRIAPRPVLLISGGHGSADEELNSVYRDAGGPTVTHWEIAEAGHTGGLAAVPDEYERRVVGFFDQALLGR
jgi:dienelactone hydrolase